jgi:hypothetical protein
MTGADQTRELRWALDALEYQWSPLEEHLGHLAEADPEPQVRRAADIALVVRGGARLWGLHDRSEWRAWFPETSEDLPG